MDGTGWSPLTPRNVYQISFPQMLRKMPAAGARQILWAVTGILLQAWIIFPWALFAWLGMVIACRRWSGAELALSLRVSVCGAVVGWHLINRLGNRLHDVQMGDLLIGVEDAPLWALSLHPVQVTKRMHTTHCRHCWGVTPRASGWELFRRAWSTDAVGVLICLALCVHPWWLGL